MVTAQDRMVAARFRDVAAELDVRRGRVVSALDGLGAPWGAEPAGVQFAEGYLHGAGVALQTAVSLARRLEEIAAVLAEDLERTEATDRTIGDSLRAVRPSVEREQG